MKARPHWGGLPKMVLLAMGGEGLWPENKMSREAAHFAEAVLIFIQMPLFQILVLCEVS